MTVNLRESGFLTRLDAWIRRDVDPAHRFHQDPAARNRAYRALGLRLTHPLLRARANPIRTHERRQTLRMRVNSRRSTYDEWGGPQGISTHFDVRFSDRDPSPGLLGFDSS